MEKFKAEDIKLGILSDVSKRKLKESGDKVNMLTYGKDLRGIMFTQEGKVGNDILYPFFHYPIIGKENITSSLMAITRNQNLSPLFKYYNIDTFTYEDLKLFLKDTILSEKWLREYEYLFHPLEENFLNMNITTFKNGEELPQDLGLLIGKVQDINGFVLSRKEQKLIRTRR